MKVIILAGGFGTRLSEYTKTIPKPMIDINGKPILFHIMKQYANYGFKNFYIALGYKGEVIKRFFKRKFFDWNIHLIETGKNTMTGGRLKRLKKYIGKETFMMTYGDGVADVNIRELVDFHKTHGKLATVTAVRPPARFGSLTLDGSNVRGFAEKPQLGEGWINGGYFVFEPEIADYIGGDETFLEREPLENLAQDGQLMAFKHSSFWQPMDTLRDLQTLRKRWDANDAPWRVWK